MLNLVVIVEEKDVVVGCLNFCEAAAMSSQNLPSSILDLLSVILDLKRTK